MAVIVYILFYQFVQLFKRGSKLYMGVQIL